MVRERDEGDNARRGVRFEGEAGELGLFTREENSGKRGRTVGRRALTVGLRYLAVGIAHRADPILLFDFALKLEARPEISRNGQLVESDRAEAVGERWRGTERGRCGAASLERCGAERRPFRAEIPFPSVVLFAHCTDWIGCGCTRCAW